MSRYIDTLRIKDAFLDKRVKLLPCQKEAVLSMHNRGASIRSIARMYKVDKRLIQFIIFPERKERSLELRRERGGGKIYYKREKHTECMRNHRAHKKEIYGKFRD